MKKYIAIGETKKGTVFYYKDKAKNIICFLEYLKELYPDVEIVSVTSI